MYIEVVETASALARLSIRGTVVVALDIFRATSTMITALAQGVQVILPVASEEEAFAFQVRYPRAILGGERYGEPIRGFKLGNSPLEYQGEQLRDSTLIFMSTNGTKAILAAKEAEKIYLGSFLNALPIAQKLRDEKDIILACAGTKGTYSLEDTCCAGYIIHLLRKLGKPEFSDSAMAALAVYETYQANLTKHLSLSTNGRALVGRGHLADIQYCCTRNMLSLVPEYIPREGILPFPCEERRNCTL